MVQEFELGGQLLASPPTQNFDQLMILFGNSFEFISKGFQKYLISFKILNQATRHTLPKPSE